MRRVSSGLVDAGASSIATLVAGIFATRQLSPVELGFYALIFSAWTLTSQIPTQLALVPAEAQLVSVDPRLRYGSFPTNMRLASPWLVASALGVLLVMTVSPEGITEKAMVFLAVSGAALAALFPLQEHARRLLHLAGEHWSAASISVIRLLATIGFLVIGSALDVDASLLPLGSLALADGVAVGVAFFLPAVRPRVAVDYGARQLLSSGRWLLLGALVVPAAGFLVNLLVTHFASARDLGLSEAARVAAQPALVLAVGLSAVMRPAAMAAAAEGAEDRALRLTARFSAGLSFVGLAYVLLTLLPSRWNPVQVMIPAAFEVFGLVQLSIVAAVVNGVVFLRRSELIAVNRTKELLYAEAWAGAGRASAAVGASSLRSWTVPIGFLAGGLVRVLSIHRSAERYYDEVPEAE